MNRFKLFFIIFFSISVILYFFGFFNSTEDWIYENIANSRDRRITFFGKVEDEYGQPVKNVKIQIIWYKCIVSRRPLIWLPRDKFVLKTNSDGIFSIKKKRGHEFSVLLFDKPGYDFSNASSSANDHFSSVSTPSINRLPGIDQPILYKVRKKGVQTFVLRLDLAGWHNAFEFTNAESGTRKGCDILQGRTIAEKEIAHLKKLDEHLPLDLTTTAVRDPKTGGWTFSLEAADPLGGFLLSDQLLYEAPTEGYRRSLTFYLPPGYREDKRYMYLRVRSPHLYARIALGRSRVGPEGFSFGMGQPWLNPYGERNFENVTGLSGDITFKLWQEAREALHMGRVATKPNLAKLVQEWERNRPFTDRIKEWFN